MSLEHIEIDDTVNVWLQKLNALVDYLNNLRVEGLIVRDSVEPTENLFFGKLWFNTDTNTLMIFDDISSSWIDWNRFFVPAMKFMQKSITQNYVVPSTKHAITVSPTIESGVTVTVSSGSILVVT